MAQRHTEKTIRAALLTIREGRLAQVQLGQMIRLLREMKGLSQREFARLLGVTAQYLSDIENNARVPGYKFAERLDEVLAPKASQNNQN
jgi:DNA-binding transcriptional regulator YiaG